MKCDYLIVGAGIASLVLAERLSSVGKTCLIVETRSHIGGNCHDHYDDTGVLTHTYGPHYFRTDFPEVKEYLSRFTEWKELEYTIKAYTDGKYWSFPINLNTFEELIGRQSTSEEFAEWLKEQRVDVEPKNSEDVVISQVGRLLYEKFFLGYTLKQWKKHPRELDASVCGRIPVRTNRDNRYLKESFQALPAAGYTRMFEKMLAACGKNVKVLLNTDYREVVDTVQFSHMIYTGPIDEYFNCCYGPLPYRSLRFEKQHFDCEFFQPAMQVNYPNTEEYTRIVEIKHATGQKCTNTSIVLEYPDEYGPGKEPYYPIPSDSSAALYNKYAELGALEKNVSFVGRLATYKYYNMDQIVKAALGEFQKLIS